MVLDIEKYPEFVPWCLEGKIHEKNESHDLIEIKGDLKVGKRFLNETYTSLVLYYKDKDKILVTNIDGPLNHLSNKWSFIQQNNQTEVTFDIDFEIKNKFLNTIMEASFKFGLEKIANAFQKRAEKLFSDTKN